MCVCILLNHDKKEQKTKYLGTLRMKICKIMKSPDYGEGVRSSRPVPDQIKAVDYSAAHGNSSIPQSGIIFHNK